MSDVASFGNIVNSLLSVRQNYHEQLKTVPQYEAYLLVQSSTEKAAGALNVSAEAPASIAAEVIDSLQFARSRFEQHLGSVPEYRTLLAIDKLIKEISIDLGITKPEQARIPDVPELEVTAPGPVSVASVAPEPDEVVAAAPAEPEPAEVTAESPPVEAPVQPSRATTTSIEDALPEEDDIVPVHTLRGEIVTDGAGDEDLPEIAYRDVAKATVETLVATEGTPGAAASHTATPPPPKLFDEDTDEAAA